MSGEQMSIDRYIGQLATRLDVSDEERGATLQEVRAHLDELAANSMADGATEAEAQRRAVETFGDVRTLGRRLSAARLVIWNKARWARGIALGALLSYLIWTVGTFPVELYYQTNTRGTLAHLEALLLQYLSILGTHSGNPSLQLTAHFSPTSPLDGFG